MTREKLGMEESIKGLRIGEVKSFERALGKTMDQMSGTEVSAATVFVYEKRRALADNLDIPTLASFDEWTLQEIEDYFAADETKVIPSEPETAQGKDDSLVS